MLPEKVCLHIDGSPATLGTGWLPYEYVLQRLALDFWSILSMEMVETKQFGL